MFEFPLGSSGNVSNNNLSCYNFTKKEFEAIFWAKESIASLGVIASLVVILLIIVSKSYKSFVFRLVVYFMLSNIFQAITHILELIPVKRPRDGMDGIEDVVEVKGDRGWESACAAIGYLDQVTLWMGNMVILWIIFYMLWLTYQLKRVMNGEPAESIWQYGRSFRVELFGLFLVFVFPFTFNVIPFGWNMYGLSGPWCWIKLSKDMLCKKSDLSLGLMFGMYYVPLVIIILFSFVGFVAIIIILCRGALGKKVARKVYRRGVTKMVLISIYPLFYNLLCLIMVANRIVSVMVDYENKRPMFVLWMAHAIADPMRVLVPPIAFLLHPNSWKGMFSKKKFDSSSKNLLSATPADVSNADNGVPNYGAIYTSTKQ